MRYNLRNVFSFKKMLDEKFFNKVMLYFILSCISFFNNLLFIKNLFILQSSSN